MLKPKTKRIEKVIQTDVPKENKGINNVENACPMPGTSTKIAARASGSGSSGKVTPPKLARKIATKFAKKDSVAPAVASIKKTKILGETATLKIDSRTNKDSNVTRKKIKLSPQRTETTTEPLITCFGETSIKYTSAVDTFDMCFTTAHNVTSTTFSSTSLPNFFTQTSILHDPTCGTVPNLTKLATVEMDDSLDAGCSYSLPATTETSVVGVKEFKSKFGKATGGGVGGAKVKVAKVGTDVTKSKLKKKRTLRADTSIKRKKTRVKPVVC